MKHRLVKIAAVLGAALLLAVLCGLLVVSRPASAANGVTWEEYWELVEETQAICDTLKDAPSVVAAPEFKRLAIRWKGITRITLPNRATVNVDHTALLTLLQADPPNVARFCGAIATLSVERDAYDNRPYNPADFQTLERILAQAQYQWPQAGPSLLDDFWEALSNWLNHLLNRLFGNAFSGVAVDVFNLIFIVFGAIVLVIIFIFVLRSVSLNLVAESQANAGDDEKSLTADAALKRAQALSGEGDYRSAVRYLYLSSLLLLEEHGLLRYDRSKTNREYLRAVANQPTLSTRLRGVVDVFDRVWYGFQNIDQNTFDKYSEQVEELRKQKPES